MQRSGDAVLETGHLVVETLADAVVAADLIGFGDEPVVEGDLVGVHAAVTDGVDRPTLHLSAAGCATVGARILHEREAVALTSGLGHDEHGEAAVGE